MCSFEDRLLKLWIPLHAALNSEHQRLMRFNRTSSYKIKALNLRSIAKQHKPEIYRTEAKTEPAAGFTQKPATGAARERDTSSGQPLRHHLTVHDGDVDEEEQDDEEVVHEAQQPHHALGDEVQRRGQVRQRAHQTQQDPDAEHPEEAADGEHLSERVPQQRRDVPQTVQQLQESNTNTF